MTGSRYLRPFCAAAFSSDSDGFVVLLVVLLIGLGIAFIKNQNDQFRKLEEQRKEEQFRSERERTRETAKPFRHSELVQALSKKILFLPETPEVSSIRIGTDCMTVTFAGDQNGENTKTVSYESVSHKDLNEENCVPIACALAAELGPPYHIEYEDGQPTAALTVVRGKLLDPNVRARKES